MRPAVSIAPSRYPAPFGAGWSIWSGRWRRSIASCCLPKLHGVTMTGELVDLFADRSEGVGRLIDSMLAHYPGRQLRFYGGGVGFLAPAEAKAQPLRVASANWHATGRYLAERGETGLLVDIGSTTTDILPIVGGAVRCEGFSDEARMVLDELVYTGVTRTPVMVLARNRPLRRAAPAAHGRIFRDRGGCPSPDRRTARGCRSARHGGRTGQKRRGERRPPRAHAGARPGERRYGGVAAARATTWRSASGGWCRMPWIAWSRAGCCRRPHP